MKIRVFAILKDYYAESFEIEGSEIASISDLKNKLIALNNSAASVLNSCRFAINQEFVQANHKLKEDEDIYIIPPSSGG